MKFFQDIASKKAHKRGLMRGLLENVLAKRPEDLLVPNEELKESSLKALKTYLDPIASQYSVFDNLHVEGLDADQIWTQTRMIIDGVVEKLLVDEIPQLAKKPRLSSEDEDEEESIRSESDIEDEEDVEVEESNSEDESEADSLDEEEDEDMDVDVDVDVDLDEEEGSELIDYADEPKTHELDEGTFRIEDFKKQVLALENDELNGSSGNEDVDYFAKADEEADVENDLNYDDFFAPAKRAKTIKSGKNAKRREKVVEQQDIDDEDFDIDADPENIEQAMKSARKDLFMSDSEDEHVNDNKTRLSTFEKQQREIQTQIEKLEAENVAEKKWQVRGEVSARDRPLESLIEADLDFERSSKPVPVITQESTDSLEDVIRKRIKEADFDEIPRRLPDSLPEFAPSRAIEVQETKSQKSLAELYEDDYAKKADPLYKDAVTQQLSKAHEEVIDLYNKLSYKLDGLSSWNYTPRAPDTSISIVTNAAAISMEDAQPLSMTSESRLAPQEVYRPESSNKREIIAPNGLPVAKDEMTREERKRVRRREKTKKAKAAQAREEKEKAKAVSKTGSKADIIQTLKKGNVTIIGKRGEKRDITGKIKTDSKRPIGSNIKL